MHVNTLYNLAVMFDTHCDRKTEAEALYRRALSEEPAHTFAMYNLAVLLEERLEIEPFMMSSSNISTRSTTISNMSHADVGILDPSSLMEDPKGIDVTELSAFKDVKRLHSVQEKDKDSLIKEITALHEQAMLLNPSDVSTIADYGR